MAVSERLHGPHLTNRKANTTMMTITQPMTGKELPPSPEPHEDA